MWKNGIYKLLVISIVLAVAASSVSVFSAADLGEGIAEEEIDESGGDGIISLAPPPFITAASANDAGGGGAFPEDGAGIAAYVFTNQTININGLKPIFNYVYSVGDNYIIGRTPIPNFGGNINVRVYADTDGWLVAYLSMTEPAAKIMKWKTADVNNPKFGVISTTLEEALIKAGGEAGVGIDKNEIKYYDFEFPNANGMMIFVRTKATHGYNRVQVMIPANYTLFEASYYHYIYYYSSYKKTQYPYKYYETYWDSNLKVGGVTISDASTSYQWDGKYKWWRAFDTYHGAITTGKLHSILIYYEPREKDGESYSTALDYGSAGVATVLIYRTA